MTTVQTVSIGNGHFESDIQESVYKVDEKNELAKKQIKEKEAQLIREAEKSGKVVLKCNSELISKRRYSRRRNKVLLQMAKKYKKEENV